MKTPNVFPFVLNHPEGHRQFQCYFQKNKAEITEKHGRIVFTGRGPTGREKMWSYYEVDVTIIDDVTMEFQTYGMRDSYSGGRGDAHEKFVHRFESKRSLKSYVETRKREIATQVFDERAREAARKQREEDIDAVYRELFRPGATKN